jgi:hypothetical protein
MKQLSAYLAYHDNGRNKRHQDYEQEKQKDYQQGHNSLLTPRLEVTSTKIVDYLGYQCCEWRRAWYRRFIAP